MKQVLIIAASLALAGCGSIQSAGSQAVTAADYVYTAAEQTGRALVTAGQYNPAQFKADAANAYNVLLAVRAGNATIDQLITAVAVMKGKQP